jgi:large subunit ribosomal protein L23
MNQQGKKKRQRTANFGRTAHWKKAVVTLADGSTIDLT